MAVSGISSSSINNSQPSNLQLLREQFAQLVKALNSGDLAGAQQACAAISQSQGTNAGNANSPFSQALNQIGQALDSGDLAGAQKALASLQQQMAAQRGAQGAHRGHHHHHHGGSPPAPTTAATDSNGSTTGGSGVDLTV